VPKLVNTKTMVAENVPADQASDLFLSGSHNLPRQSRIALNDSMGNPVNVDSSEVYEALQNGYSFADDEAVRKAEVQEKYGKGLGDDLKAFAAGAARGITFGGSDLALTGSGLVKPETLAGLEEANPIPSTVGEVGGIVGSLAVPFATPVGAVAKAGRAVEGAIASKLASETTKGIARRVIEGAVPLAAGSAVEGAFYGAGQVLSDKALGDPDLTAEKALSEIGLSVMLSGGIGGALGAAGGLLPKGASKVSKGVRAAADDVDEYLPPIQPPSNPANLAQSIDEMKVSENARTSLLKGLTDLKSNADEIRQAAQMLDAPLLEGQISASKHIQDLDSMLITSSAPTPIAVARQELARDGWQKAEKAVVDTLADATDQSLAEVGTSVKTSLVGKINKELEPITAMYDNLSQFGQIPVAARSLKQVARNIEHLEGIGKLSPGSAAARFQKQTARELPNLKTIDDIKTYKKIVRAEITQDTKYIRGRVLEKLDNLEEAAILKAAKDFQGVPELKAMMDDLVRKNSEVKSAYKAFRGKMEELGSALGKKKIYGKQDFVDFVEDLSPEKLATRLFAKNDSQFLKFFSQNFPEETAALLRYQRSQLLNGAMKGENLDVKALVKAIDKFSPEVRSIMFTPDQLTRIKAAKTYMDAFPGPINPSGTSKAESYKRFLTNPFSAAAETAKDYVTQKTIEKAVSMSGESARGVRTLMGLERIGNGAANKLARGVKNALTTSTGPAYLGAKIATRDNVPRGTRKDDSAESPTKRYQSRVDNIAKLTRDANSLLDTMEKSTSTLYPYAPRVTASLHASMIRAVSFLQAKLPKSPLPAKPFSAPWVPAASEIAKFDRYYNAVENPMVALTQIGDGTLTTETVEAVASVYPKLYESMSQELLTRVIDMGPQNVPYQKRLMLSLFMNQDLDESTTSQAIASNQATIMGPSQQEDAQQPSVRPTQGGASKLTLGQRNLTPQQQSAARTA
jgi:hypothetical protein